MRFYFEVARTAFRRQLIYRWSNLAGLVTNIFFGMIFSYVLIALYHARPVVAGYDVNEAIRYTWLIQAMIMVVMTFGWQDLLLTIRSGEVVSDLSKPCDFHWYWFSREIGRSAYYFFYRGVPTYVAGALLFGLGMPGSWRDWLAYSLALPLAAMLGITYRYLYNIAAFWIVEARALVTMATVIALFFTGYYIPIPFFPAWLRVITDWLPFSGMMNLPAQVLLGKISGNALWLTLVNQIIWLIILTCIVRLLTTIATRRVIVQGG